MFWRRPGSSCCQASSARSFAVASLPWAARYDIGDVLQYQRGSNEHDIAAKSFARVVDVDSAKNLLTVEKQDGQRVEYNPERLKGVNVYKELDREFATGDRLQFTALDKKLGVANRDLATIEAITPATAAQASQITVKMDAGHCCLVSQSR